MDRRKFIQSLAMGSIAWSLGIPRLFLNDLARAEPGRISRISVARGSSYKDLVGKVLAPLGGIQAFVRPGDRVVIKPNMGFDRAPEYGATTHPLVIEALALLSVKAGADRVLIFDNPCNESRRCYVNSGILPAFEVLDDRKIRCEYLDRRKFVPMELERGKTLKRWEIYREALEADCYINLPVAKHHSLTGLSLGLKNNMGILGGDRGKLHQDIDQNLADLATVIKPTLTIIDATRLLLRNGPQGGNLEDVRIADTLIASTDPVAADAYATTLFDMAPDSIGSTRAAAEMGLGQISLDKIKITELKL